MFNPILLTIISNYLGCLDERWKIILKLKFNGTFIFTRNWNGTTWFFISNFINTTIRYWISETLTEFGFINMKKEFEISQVQITSYSFLWSLYCWVFWLYLFSKNLSWINIIRLYNCLHYIVFCRPSMLLLSLII